MSKFNVGDKVRVLNNDSNYSEDFTGQESKIIATEQCWCKIKVQYKDGGYNFLPFNENELEKVVEQPSTIPVGAIVKITIDSEIGDEKLYVNYGIIHNYNEGKPHHTHEYYDVAVIFNKDREFYESVYYPRQLEVVYPEKVAPDLWGSVADKLTDSEKINLVHEIFHNPSFENDITISGSFLWSTSKKGDKYWEEINNRITMNELEPGAAFKVGDRVRFYCPDLEVDYGTIVERHAENSWWIDWESGYYQYCNEKYLTVVDVEQPEEIPTKINAADILQQAKDCLVNRASERDKEQERSMKSCVEAFNALTGKSLTETEGWIFMTVLKLARSQGGSFKLDDYVDMAAYAALAGESGSK